MHYVMFSKFSKNALNCGYRMIALYLLAKGKANQDIFLLYILYIFLLYILYFYIFLLSNIFRIYLHDLERWVINRVPFKFSSLLLIIKNFFIVLKVCNEHIIH